MWDRLEVEEELNKLEEIADGKHLHLLSVQLNQDDIDKKIHIHGKFITHILIVNWQQRYSICVKYDHINMFTNKENCAYKG